MPFSPALKPLPLYSRPITRGRVQRECALSTETPQGQTTARLNYIIIKKLWPLPASDLALRNTLTDIKQLICIIKFKLEKNRSLKKLKFKIPKIFKILSTHWQQNKVRKFVNKLKLNRKINFYFKFCKKCFKKDRI